MEAPVYLKPVFTLPHDFAWLATGSRRKYNSILVGGPLTSPLREWSRGLIENIIPQLGLLNEPP